MTMELVRLKYSHQAMVDMMVGNPSITVRELAARFGMTEQWIYKVRASGMFREMLAQRTTEVVDPILAANVEERFDCLLNRSAEVLMEKLSRDVSEVSDDLAIEAGKLAAKAKGLGGFGAKVAPAPAPPPVDRMERLASRLRSLNGVAVEQEVVDVESREVSEAVPQGASGVSAERELPRPSTS